MRPARSRPRGMLLAAAVGVVVAGSVLRLYTPSPMWLDEAQTVAISDRPFASVFDALRVDGAPPLYYVLLHGWLKVFGTSDLAVRALSSLFSLLALPLAYWVGTRLGGSRRHGWLFLVLLASNPWSVRYAIEARQYSLVAFLSLLGVAAAILLHARAGRDDRRGEAVAVVGVGLVTGALLLTHYWAIFLGAAVGAWLLWRAVRSTGAQRREAVLGVAGLAIGALLFLPWVPTFLHQAAHTGAPWAETPSLTAISSLPAEWFGGEGPAGRTLSLLVWPLMLLGILGRPHASHGVTLDLRARTPGPGKTIAGIVLGTLVLGLVASMATGGAMVGRYTAVVVPLAVFLVALGVAVLPRRYALAAVGTLAAVGLLAAVTIVRLDKSQSAQVAAVLDAQTRPGDVVVYCPDQLAPAVLGRLDAPGLVTLTRPAQPEPRLVDWTDYEKRIAAEPHGPLLDRAAAASAAGHSVWLVVAPQGYRTHQEDCPLLRDGLGTRLGTPETVLDYADKTFERADVLRYRPRG